MKKIILLIITILLLTGCSTEYNLEFKEGKFKDSIKIGEFKAEEVGSLDTLEPIASYKDYDIKYYSFTFKDNYLNLNHEYLYDEYRVSSALKDCFELSGIFYDDDYYYIDTSGEFKCLSYMNYKNDTVKINFSSDLEVESSNADTIVDNVYTWIFNDNNYTNKNIEITLKKAKEENNNDIIEKNKKESSNSTITYFSIVIIIVIILFIIYTIFKKYSDKKNKIPE